MKKPLCSELFLVVLLLFSRLALGQNIATEGGRDLRDARVGAVRRDVNEPLKWTEEERADALVREQARRQQQEKRRQQLRQMRRERLNGGKGPGSIPELERMRRELGKGMDPRQQLKALEAQSAQEEAKHLRRVARLERISTLASDEASRRVAARAEALVRKERMRYARKRQRLDMRMRMLMRMQERRQRPTQQPKQEELPTMRRGPSEERLPTQYPGKKREP
jgi:hypothetical protein